MRSTRRWAWVALVLGLLGFGFMAGMTAEFVAAPSKVIRRAVASLRPPKPATVVANPDVDSIFIHFKRETIPLPIPRYGRGGAVTVVDNTAVAATLDGKLFMAGSAQSVQPLDIAVPDYAFDAYRALADDPAYKDYHFEYWAYRYFDILAFNYDGQERLALSFVKYEAERACFHTVVAMLDIPSTAAELANFSARAEDWKTLFVTEPCLPLKKTGSAIEIQIGGGRMAYDGKGKLVLGSGDFHFDAIFADGPPIAPDPAYDYGKVIEIDLASGAHRQIARGVRNMQGMAFDGKGQLWAVEHGLRGGDELNLIREGKDYGWPYESLGTLYNQLPIPNTLSFGRHEVHEPPIYAFVPSVAISSLDLIDGFNSAWDGDILMGTLKDESLYRFRIVDNRVMFAERVPVGTRIRAARQLDADRLVLFTDNNELVFLTENPNGAATAFLTAYLEQDTLPAHTRDRLKANMDTCLTCHSLDPDVNDFAPSLAAIVGAPRGKRPFPNYSPTLRAEDGAWTTESLAAFLSNPASVAPGTTMPDPGIRDPEEIDAVVAFLAAMGSPMNLAPETATP